MDETTKSPGDAEADALDPALELERIRASRARLVADAELERQDLARRLHDGVQQQLIALATRIELSRETNEEGDAVRETLAASGSDLRQALAELRQLAEAIRPALLHSRSLPTSVRAAAAAAGVTVHLEAEGLEHVPAAVLYPVYLCCLRAVRAVGEAASAPRCLTIRLRADADVIRIGLERDADHEQGKAGFRQWVEDRIEAAGGSISSTSQHPRGERVRGQIPLRP